MLPVLEDRPLSFCDYRSVDKLDLIACDRVIPTRAGAIYYLRDNADQRWYGHEANVLIVNYTNHDNRPWVDHFTSEELILMLMYDSGRGSQAKCESR